MRTSKIILEIEEKYSMHIELNAPDDEEFAIKKISVLPDIEPEDIQYKCDISVKEGYTIASPEVIMEFADRCYIMGTHIYERIREAMWKKIHYTIDQSTVKIMEQGGYIESQNVKPIMEVNATESQRTGTH